MFELSFKVVIVFVYLMMVFIVFYLYIIKKVHKLRFKKLLLIHLVVSVSNNIGRILNFFRRSSDIIINFNNDIIYHTLLFQFLKPHCMA